VSSSSTLSSTTWISCSRSSELASVSVAGSDAASFDRKAFSASDSRLTAACERFSI
jgi:hypothetical protein